MSTILKVFGVLFILLIVLAVLVLGYFGFVPGVSTIFGSNAPRDLGITYSEKNFETALNKANVELKKLPENSDKSISYEGSHEVKKSFTSEELTAHAFNKDWIHYPVQDLQVKINEDGTGEIAGIARIDRLDEFFSAMGFNPGNYKEAMKKAKLPIKNMPFYAKGYGSAKDNTFDLNITTFEIGRFPVPQNILQENKGLVEDFGYAITRNIPGFSVKEAKFENGAIYFDGTLPNIEYTK